MLKSYGEGGRKEENWTEKEPAEKTITTSKDQEPPRLKSPILQGKDGRTKKEGVGFNPHPIAGGVLGPEKFRNKT